MQGMAVRSTDEMPPPPPDEESSKIKNGQGGGGGFDHDPLIVGLFQKLPESQADLEGDCSP